MQEHLLRVGVSNNLNVYKKNVGIEIDWFNVWSYLDKVLSIIAVLTAKLHFVAILPWERNRKRGFSAPSVGRSNNYNHTNNYGAT